MSYNAHYRLVPGIPAVHSMSVVVVWWGWGVEPHACPTGHITDSGHLATLGVGLQTSLEWTVLASEIHTVHRHSECGPPDFT